MSQAESGRTPFAELEVLIIEDEAIVSFLVEDMLMELGCGVVRHAGAWPKALAALQIKQPDMAVLDVGLGGLIGSRAPCGGAGRPRPSSPPGLWCVRAPARMEGAALLPKPFQLAALAAGLRAALAGSGDSHRAQGDRSRACAG